MNGDARALAAEAAALRGDVGEAISILTKPPPNQIAAVDAAWGDRILGRFDRATPPTATIDAAGFEPVLAAYRSYWWWAVIQPENRDEHEAQLITTLRSVLSEAGMAQGEEANFDDVEMAVTALAVKEGFHLLLGTTPPLRECMAWRSQRETVERVLLPDGEQDTPVVYLNDFISFGWIEYATCGRRCANGWATGDSVFAVVPRYDSLDSEYFRINLLTHEAQHFADHSRFPGLLPWELEYRAKLAELALTVELRDALLEKFSADRSDNQSLPHPYANARVIEGVNGATDRSETARELLTADTARRQLTPLPKH